MNISTDACCKSAVQHADAVPPEELPHARDQACHQTISGRHLSDPDVPSPNQKKNQENLRNADGFLPKLPVVESMSQHAHDDIPASGKPKTTERELKPGRSIANSTVCHLVTVERPGLVRFLCVSICERTEYKHSLRASEDLVIW